MNRKFIQRLLQIHQSNTGTIKPNGRGIDQHSTWFHDCRYGLSSGKRGEMGVNVESGFRFGYCGVENP
jgi:hypothetical protein